MKKIKILLLAMVLGTLASCSSDDDSGSTTPMDIEVDGSLNLSAITSLPDGADITAFVTFGNGVSAANYTTEAIIGDEITYNINTSSSASTIWIAGFAYSSGDINLWETGLEPVYLANIPGADQGEEMIAGFKVLDGATTESEVKLDIFVNIVNNGVIDRSKTFTIDPKIKIRTSR